MAKDLGGILCGLWTVQTASSRESVLASTAKAYFCLIPAKAVSLTQMGLKTDRTSREWVQSRRHGEGHTIQ